MGRSASSHKNHTSCANISLPQAFKADGIKTFKLVGKVKQQDREEVVINFDEYSGNAVMLLSGVGMTGINLSSAWIMITVVCFILKQPNN